MVEAKQFILNLIGENKKLKEDINMRKLKEQNIAKSDTQVNPAQPVAKSDGSPIDAKNASQDDLAQKYKEQNVAAKDIQANPAEPAKASSGTPLQAEPASADQPVKPSVMEKTPEMEDEKEEPKEDKVGEDGKFKEFEGDMEKITEILEAMKGRIEALEKKIMSSAVAPEEKPEMPLKAEEPMPPMAERAQLGLGSVFVESIKTADTNFGKAVHKVIFN